MDLWLISQYEEQIVSPIQSAGPRHNGERKQKDRGNEFWIA